MTPINAWVFQGFTRILWVFLRVHRHHPPGQECHFFHRECYLWDLPHHMQTPEVHTHFPQEQRVHTPPSYSWRAVPPLESDTAQDQDNIRENGHFPEVRASVRVLEAPSHMPYLADFRWYSCCIPGIVYEKWKIPESHDPPVWCVLIVHRIRSLFSSHSSQWLLSEKSASHSRRQTHS